MLPSHSDCGFTDIDIIDEQLQMKLFYGVIRGISTSAAGFLPPPYSAAVGTVVNVGFELYDPFRTSIN